ncbi:hypothetical protein CISG_08268 [Coccidioides immitis RMSCC 3703]|uniref:Uncharacterized protein n=2 Tax=Coccidioides immitis TaxID=5501 RepID=A0A0J8R6V4_COCIT|nr:hypothetical protein CIRG_04338 [Coccidioides immitis RMSCC 2394]KMU80160.1 hypothetical protein CISG_08268 [Coccidioides immitis RMSCC 3703]
MSIPQSPALKETLESRQKLHSPPDEKYDSETSLRTESDRAASTGAPRPAPGTNNAGELSSDSHGILDTSRPKGQGEIGVKPPNFGSIDSKRQRARAEEI